jgi:hypothetical protein
MLAGVVSLRSRESAVFSVLASYAVTRVHFLPHFSFMREADDVLC